LVFGFALAGCDKDDDSSGPLDGRWESEHYIITITGKDWYLRTLASETDTAKGTLKLEDKAITLTTTHGYVNGVWIEVPSTLSYTGTLRDSNSFDLTINRESELFTKE
jgi:hypothetical protein